MFKVSYIDISNIDENKYNDLFSLLPLSRQERINKINQYKDKLFSLGASYLLIKGLNELGYKDIDFKYNENGKPYLVDIPLFFNLSHSGNLAICVISDQEVGIDIELTNRYKDDLLKMVSTELEYKYINNSDNKELLFTRLWTIKESVMKYLGTGLKIAPKHIEIDFMDKLSIKVNNEKLNVDVKIFEMENYCISVGARCIENFKLRNISVS